VDCRNCGAPMELFERRRYYFCTYCGTFHFIDTPAVEGVHVLERPATALPCPLCTAPLAKSLLDEAHVIESCEQCRGVLMPRAEFAAAIAARRARDSGPLSSPAPIDRRELARKVTCSSCRAPMDVHPYYGPGNVVIDTCSRCDLIWLDFGELKQIADAPGRDRGRQIVDLLQ
jgi:Zn-finger nucleic acid-binding protein